MEFETKRELLEYLGRNPNDNKLVDRMIGRGEVEKRDGMYYLIVDDEVNVLKRKVKELEFQLAMGDGNGEMVAKGLYEDEQRENGELRERVLELERKLKDMESSKGSSNDEVSDLEYQIQVNEKLEKLIVQYQEAIKKGYEIYIEGDKKIKTPRPQYKDRIGLKLDVKGEDNQ